MPLLLMLSVEQINIKVFRINIFEIEQTNMAKECLLKINLNLIFDDILKLPRK